MANTYQMRIGFHNGSGNFFESVLHYQLTETGTGTLPYDYAGSLISKWRTDNEANMLACLGNDVYVDFYAAKRITGGGGPENVVLTQTSIGTGASVSAGASISANIAVYTSAPTNRQGHVYLGGIPKGDVSEDQIIDPTRAALITFGTGLQAPMTLAGTLGTATFGIWSKKLLTLFAAV